MPSEMLRVLVLCKTYPSPSGAHTETSCVAGVNEMGQLIRLFPVPFRLVRDDQQFKKWQWINSRIEKAKKDHRPESHKIFVDTIQCDGDPLTTADEWKLRRKALQQSETFSDFQHLENARKAKGVTLGLLRPAALLGLDITEVSNPEWTDDERSKLLQNQHQGGLFDDTDAKHIAMLRKLPYDFHYRYQCTSGGQTYEYRHKIVDWEAGALFWNCKHRYGAKWEAPFRAKLEASMASADLTFLMGTIHRFPDRWLIVSLIYPPKQRERQQDQHSILDLLGE